MNEDRKLLVGLDIGDRVIQMSCFDHKLFEPVSIGYMVNGERQYELSPAIAVKDGEWLWGDAALAADTSYIHVDNIIDCIRLYDKFEAGGYTFHSKEVMKRFLTKELSLLNEYYPNNRIKKLVVTMVDKEERLAYYITQACEELGIKSDRLVLQSHKQSYMYYAVSQAKELWLNNVGLFEYEREGLTYSQISIDRRSIPYIVGVEKKDLSDLMPYSMIEQEGDIDLSYAFNNVAGTVLHKQMVTTIYVTGEGFAGEWAKEALKQLCTGRRVFRGQNLFTKGACYAAREFCGEGKLGEFIFLDEDMITSDVSIRVYHDAQMQDIVLAKAGTVWSDIDSSIDVIPDGEDEIQIITRNVMLHETKAHMLSLSGFEGRENKMTRFTIRLRFADKDTCIVTLKDNGFGEFCPSTNRIWERYISIK